MLHFSLKKIALTMFTSRSSISSQTGAVEGMRGV